MTEPIRHLDKWGNIPIENVTTEELREGLRATRKRLARALDRGSVVADGWLRLTLALEQVINERENENVSD